MPLIQHRELPSLTRLQDEGYTVLPPDRANHQDIRELHIGFLNMMPDAALEATERQFLRLIGDSNRIAQFYVHPFSLPELERGAEAEKHIAQYYSTFETLQNDGLDALIITGANVANPDLQDESFWAPLQTVMDWAWNNVTSTLCSCLTTHAVMQFRYGQKRTLFDQKLWGVYRHKVLNRDHPVVAGMNTVFDVPHSRNNTVSRVQFDKAGMTTLVESRSGEVHVATSKDGFRLICFQGHPEYDTVSLLKEYKREIERFRTGERSDYPPFPEHYFNDEIQNILNDYKATCMKDLDNCPCPPLTEIEPMLENTWRDSGKSMVGNWIGTVYQLTHMDRKKPFMDGVDPDNPLNL